MKHDNVIWMLCIGALVIRIAVAVWSPLEAEDAHEYTQIADSILRQGTYSMSGIRPDDSRPPLYPYFLAGIFYLSHASLVVVRIIQAFLDTGTMVFVYGLCRTVWDRRPVAWGAAIIYAITPAFIASSAYILSETLAIFLVVASMYFLVKAITTQRFSHYSISGICLGLLILCKPVPLFYPVFVCLICVVFGIRNKRVLGGGVIVLLLSWLLVSVWTVRNALVFHTFIPVSANAGANLWIGSYEPWNGMYHEDFVAMRNEIQQSLPDHEKGTYVLDNYLKEEALDRIVQNPLVYMRLCVFKAFSMWFFVPGENIMRSYSVIIRWGIWVIHYGTLFGVLLWFIISEKRRMLMAHVCTWGMIMCFTGMHALLVAMPRYLVPVLPLIIIYAACGYYDAWSRACKHRKTSCAS